MTDFNLYSEDYYNSLNGTFVNNRDVPVPLKSYGSTNTFIRGCLVLLLRAGFVLIQLGCVPIENVQIIILQNVVDFALSIICFGIVGYILAFGNDGFNGVVGYGSWIVSNTTDLDSAVFGLSACIIATGIITAVLSGRIHFIGCILITLVFSSLIQPVMMHWVWHEQGWLRRQYFLGHKVSVKDHAGGLIVHVCGGTVGLIGALFLNRRLIKLSDIDECSIGAESPSSTVIGYIFIALGLIGFSIPVPNYEFTHFPSNYLALILINNIMAMAAGIIVVIILQFLFFRETFNYWIVLRCMQGGVAGTVAVASGVDIYTPLFACLIATATAVVFYFVVICIHNTSVEDNCNVISVHLVCGIVSILMPPVFGSSENLGMSVPAHFRIIHLGWQLLSLSVVIAVLLCIFSILMFMLYLSDFLRNKTEEVNHRRAVTVAVRGRGRCCLQRLFSLQSSIPYIEPGIRGKSPDQYHFYLKDNYSFRETASVNDTKYIKRAVPITDDINKATKKASFETIKNQRFIYTMPNVINSPFQQSDFLDNSKCSGDSIKNADNQFKEVECLYENNLNKTSTALEKQSSCYELHATKTHTNLLKANMHFQQKA